MTTTTIPSAPRQLPLLLSLLLLQLLTGTLTCPVYATVPFVRWIGRYRGGSINADITNQAGPTTSTTEALSRMEDATSLVLQEIASSSVDLEPLSYPMNVKEAAMDFSVLHGQSAYRFLRGLASSPTFLEQFWHKRPLLIRSNEISGQWVEGAFTVENDLKGTIDGSYISGHRTADIMRNGTNTKTWHFVALKENPGRPTTWKEVEEALQGGTVYFNTAGSLWPNLGAYWSHSCLQYSFVCLFVCMSSILFRGFTPHYIFTISVARSFSACPRGVQSSSCMP